MQLPGKRTSALLRARLCLQSSTEQNCWCEEFDLGRGGEVGEQFGWVGGWPSDGDVRVLVGQQPVDVLGLSVARVCPQITRAAD
ncbi:hypothetical protein Q1695_006890 [Nippostrongylus brasiliensis]|nr:hypothetical protein Q1695_006890 [Nippostrongylus brasiliensis]